MTHARGRGCASSRAAQRVRRGRGVYPLHPHRCRCTRMVAPSDARGAATGSPAVPVAPTELEDSDCVSREQLAGVGHAGVAPQLQVALLDDERRLEDPPTLTSIETGGGRVAAIAAHACRPRRPRRAIIRAQDLVTQCLTVLPPPSRAMTYCLNAVCSPNSSHSGSSASRGGRRPTIVTPPTTSSAIERDVGERMCCPFDDGIAPKGYTQIPVADDGRVRRAALCAEAFEQLDRLAGGPPR